MYKLTTKWFDKWARKQNLTQDLLLQSIEDMDNDLSIANLGNGLFKVRVRKKGSGKSSSFRSIIIKNDRAVMVYGFSKNKKENLSHEELKHFKLLAKDILALTSEELGLLIQRNELIPIGEENER